VSTDENDQKHSQEKGVLTLDELIRSQLDGKSKALARYDQILWRIRSGYVVVLYGLLTVLAGKDFQLTGFIGTTTAIGTAFWLSVGMSACALLIDLRFLGSKLLVIDARDRLTDVALAVATGRLARHVAADQAANLLHLSGEKPLVWKKWKFLLNLNWPILTMYGVTPVVVAVAWYLTHG